MQNTIEFHLPHYEISRLSYDFASFASASRFSSMTDYDAGVLSLSFKCTVGNIPMNFSKSKQMLSLLLMPCLFTCLPLSHCLVVKHKGQFYAYNRQLETYLLSHSVLR